MERVIRPFQADDVFNARVLPPAQLPFEEAEDPSYTFGDGIPGNFKQWGFSVLNVETDWEEVSRVTTIQRVTNPQDENQFVDVERIEKLTFQSSEGQQIRFNMFND